MNAKDLLSNLEVVARKTLMELQAYAKQHGRSSGWAYMVWQGRRKRA